MSTLKCKARILKEFKRAKAEVMWPFHYAVGKPVENVEAGAYPECGGDVTVQVEKEIDGGCSCCGSTTVKITLVCSRCKAPFVDPAIPQSYDHEELLATLAEEALIARQKGL